MMTLTERVAYQKTYNKAYYAKHKEKLNARRRLAYKNADKEQVAAYMKQYQQTHKEKIAAHKKKHQNRHKEKIAAYKKIYYSQHKEKLAEKQREYNVKNKEKRAAQHAQYMKRYLRTNINARLAANLRRRLNIAVRHDFRSGSAMRDLGCSIADFKIYVEQQFTAGMAWENYGKWHLDHIKPLASFDLTDREQFLEACHYTNYQPLWAVDNLSKGAKCLH